MSGRDQASATLTSLQRQGWVARFRSVPDKENRPQAASHRVASVRPLLRRASSDALHKEHGQGTHAVPRIGFARLRPARRRLCRQGAKSVAGPGRSVFRTSQADSHRSDISCGATTRCRNTFYPTVSGHRARRSAGPSHPPTGCGFPQAAIRHASFFLRTRKIRSTSAGSSRNVTGSARRPLPCP